MPGENCDSGPGAPIEKGIKDECFEARGLIEELKKDVKGLMQHKELQDNPPLSDAGEMKANIMLAYRHLEDARMRLGKVVQAYDGGKSVYPK